MKLGIVDLGISNVGSLVTAFDRLDAPSVLASRASDLHEVSAIVLPGVGAFADGMKSLRGAELVDPIRGAARDGIPILGVCLGMQLLARRSEEHGKHEGLGLVDGDVVRLEAGNGERVPNIGWCDIHPVDSARLFAGTSAGESFYFVHSYHLSCEEQGLAAATMSFGGQEIVIAVEKGNIFGLQFHPEKSQDAGLTVLERFIGVVNTLDREKL